MLCLQLRHAHLLWRPEDEEEEGDEAEGEEEEEEGVEQVLILHLRTT